MLSTTLSLLLTIVASTPGLAQLPYGFEIFEVISNDYEPGFPTMNDCGELVFSQKSAQNPAPEVYHYDNGLLTRISASDGIRDAFPDINNPGDIVWFSGPNPNGDIHLLSGGQEMVIGRGGLSPTLNDLGHVVWSYRYDPTCMYIRRLFYYDGDTTSQLTFGEVNDQSPDINNNGAVAWTRYNFCEVPWVSEIILYVDGTETVLPRIGSQVQLPSMNQHGMVAWSSVSDVELWDGETTSVVQESAEIVYLNNLGDYWFRRWDFSVGAWNQWLYCASCDVPGTYQITNNVSWDSSKGDINDYAELVWVSYNQENWDNGSIKFLRRIRNGDVDNDRDVDAADFATLPGCLTGPVATDRLCDCRFFDMDHDRDVDLADFALFQNAHGQ